MIRELVNTFRGRIPGAGARSEQALAVIGDVHGCLALLDGLLGQISPETRPVFVGDMVDRGPDSRGVLARVRELAQEKGGIALCGNHEQMMLDFLDDPGGAQAWLQHGGCETLASFGVSASGDRTAMRDALRRALPAGTEAWLRGLPLWWQSGNVGVVHAGADPRRPLAGQDPKHLVWGHPAFGRYPRRDGVWIVHGHTVVPEATMGAGVIPVDTGAWRTGRLSAALIGPQGVRFVTAGG